MNFYAFGNYKGKYFRELSTADRDRFENYPIVVGELRESVSDNDILKIFVKINTTGKVMDETHLEKIRSMIK